MKKPEPYRPAPAKPKKKAPDAQRQSHKAGVLLTVLIICAAVLAVLLLRSLGVFARPARRDHADTRTDRSRRDRCPDRDAHAHPDAEARTDV